MVSAARLLREGGTRAVTTRAVEAAADVQAPTIYRLFGDKQGLLDAAAEHEIAEWVHAKAAAASRDEDRDPVEVLREGWFSVARFGLANPAAFRLMHDRDPAERRGAESFGEAILRTRIRRVADAGRLAVTERRALDLIRASALGAVLVLIAQPAGERELDVLEHTFQGLCASTIADAEREPPGPIPARASALRAALHEPHPALSRGEAALLDELLERLARPHPETPATAGPSPG